MRAFVSSEMETALDRARRATVVETVQELGHDAIYFEGRAARPLPKGMDAIAYCRKLVRESDVVLSIVDDDVTEAMEAELAEAELKLGTERVFYYFTKGRTRSPNASKLWNEVKESNLLATFTVNVELAGAVRKSIGSFIDDALQSVPKPGPRVVLETSQLLQVGYLHWWDFEFEAHDRLSVDLHGTGKF